MPCLHRLHRYMAVWNAQHSSCCDRGQRVLRARLTSCCCNPADTPAGRQTDRPTDKPTRRLGVFIASPPMHPHNKLHGQIRPEGKPIHNMLCLLCGIHKSAFYKYKHLSVSLHKNADTASGIGGLWSLQVKHSLFPTFWKGVHVGMFISHS